MLGVVRLLLALQAITPAGPLTESSPLQTKTPTIQPQGFQIVTNEEAPELLNNNVYVLRFVEGAESLLGTGGHPLYSLDRDDWVRVRDLQVGERLQTAAGAVTVEALERVRRTRQVYNLEVEGDHEYLVGAAGVRAHNAGGKSCMPTDGGYETYYRAMSKQDIDEFMKTGRVPSTSETFISPSRKFSEGYEGVLVKFQVAPGTTDRLRGIGVRAHGRKSAQALPDLPEVRRGWGKKKALFKLEGDITNIGLGKGDALDTFNESIRGFEILGTT